MALLQEGIYWCARDLAHSPVGNHHFVLIVAQSSQNQLGEQAKSEEANGHATHFLTLGGFKVNSLLELKINEESDVKSVREFLDPEEHTSVLIPDLDLEPHRVVPPGMQTELAFREKIAVLATNFKNHKPSIDYKLKDENCSAWVNTLFKIAGVSDPDRDRLGEFFGIDWGEEDLISEAFFHG
jgi:hypothetical protein